jgi:Pyruvate/2-oxoacid:ferredoxin oxidoreductase gamma subunit
VILSREEIYYTGIPQPDILVILTAEGLSQVPRQLQAMDETQTVYVVPELAEHVETRARKIVFKLNRAPVNRKSLAVAATTAVVRDAGLYPLDAFRDAIRFGQRAEIAEENFKAVDAGEKIL